MKLLVIGHEGYLGTGLFRYLQGRHEVRGWGRKDDIHRLSREFLLSEKFDGVVNCATVMDRVSTEFTLGSPSDQINVRGVASLVGALDGTSIKLVQISTKDVFGTVFSKEDVREEATRYRLPREVDDSQRFRPETVYAKSKLIGEWLTESHPHTTIIRLSTCYTDHEHPHSNWMAKFIGMLLASKSIQLTNQGKQLRDPLHVEDLGRLIEKVLERGAPGVKMNAGGGPENHISLLEFIRQTGLPANLQHIPGGDFGFAFNNRVARESLGWEPKIRLAERLPVLIENIRRAQGNGSA